MTATRLGDILVVGLGRSGTDVARYCVELLARSEVSSVTVYAGISNKTSQIVARELQGKGARIVFDNQVVEGSYNLGIISPGISIFDSFYQSAQSACEELISEPEFAYREDPEGWIGITGTNGKTTTVSLLAHLLSESGFPAKAVGNIGETCIEAVSNREGELFVAELSSYQLASTRLLHPQMAACLNITDDHLEWHHGMEGYINSKRMLFDNMDANELIVLDLDDPTSAQIGHNLLAHNKRVAFVSRLQKPETPDAGWIDEGAITVCLDEQVYTLAHTDELLIKGYHNQINALVASIMALEVGAESSQVTAALKSFEPLAHRLEYAGTVDGIDFYNDSKATNTDATLKALSAFEGREITLLLGGHDKGGPLEEFVEQCLAQTSAIICYGEARQRFLNAFTAHDKVDKVALAEAENMADALDVACSLADDGDIVLLSPACSSFDEFSDYAERGDVFKAAVRSLMEHPRG